MEPPNWWTNYSSPLMLLLYGENLNGANITTDYAGATIDKVQTEPDGKHAFVWLNLDSTAKPGTAALHVKNSSGETTANLLLSARPPQEGRYQGVTPDDVIYLIMPDRFADGDPSNDQPPQAAPGTYDRKSPKAYHGGDLKGVQQHLPYLKDLGVTTLWLTPLYQNDDATSDYHGYGAVNEYEVEDHFGTMHDVQNLVAAAHQLGMKVLFDMVPNHVGPHHPWANSQPTPGWLHGTPAHHLDNANYDFPPISDPHAVRANYIEALDGWFVNTLPDLAQENPFVAMYLLQNAEWWTESSGIDGIRIDTFPYVPRSFWSYYDQGLVARYPNFFMVGEVNDTDATVTSYWAGGQTGFDGIDTHLTTPFDFPMFQAIGDVVARGESAKKIVTVLRQDRFYPHPELLVTLLDNHDRPRFITQANGSPEKLKLGLSLLLTLRGIPQLYSGDEIGIPGGEDPDNRHDFPGGFPGDKNNAFTPAGRTPEQQDIFAHTQTLLKLRHDHPALRTGTQKHIAVADKYYAFTRESAGERLLIVFHNADASETVSLDLTNTSIADAKGLTLTFGPSAAQLKNGHIDLQLAPYSLTIYQVR
jgi:glycosidase